MFSALLPDGDAIDRWADAVTAPAVVPLLVRKLIARTTDPTWIDMPAGSATRFPGWDGEVEVPVGNTCVPSGRSYWEIGTDSRATKKANEEYAKRTKETPATVRGAATFVFVTPRSWAYRRRWITAMRTLSEWADVRAIDAEGLATWADSVPYVHLWLSHQIDGRAHGAEPLEQWWGRWSDFSDPHPIEPSLLLRGRATAVDQVLAWLAGPPRRLIIDSEPPDDAIAFVAAILRETNGELEHDLMRAVFVTTGEAWDELLLSPKAMIMASPTEAVWIKKAVDHGHHVLIAASPDDPGARGDLALTDITRDDLIAGLEELGLDPKDAVSFVDDADENLTTIRRRLSRYREFRSPSWSVDERVRDLVPAVLAGSWDRDNAGDREAVSQLAARPYEEVEAGLLSLSGLEDTPVRLRGTTWLLANRRDAWRLTIAAMDDAIVRRLETTVVDVLGARDPSLDLPIQERWMANVRGKSRPHGERIRHGLANTVAMLGGWRHLERVGDQSGPKIGNRVAASLLATINDDPVGGGWMSLGDVVPLIAEAAPEEFLGAVDAGLSADPSPIVALLDTAPDVGIFGRAYQSGVLWGLEGLAWSPGYLERVAGILVQWAARDPGGKWSNRPGASFRLIFLPWHPQTAATLKQRIEVLKGIADQPSAWTLLTSLLPQFSNTSGASHRPTWRTWAPPGEIKVTVGQRLEEESAVVRLLLDQIDDSAARWIELLGAYSNMVAADRELVLASLAGLDPALMSAADREAIWRRLAELIADHRAFQDAPWALSEKELQPLVAQVDRFAPEDVIAQVRWLFAQRPKVQLITGGKDHERYDDALKQLRLEALTRVRGLGWHAVDRLIDAVEWPFAVGFVIGESDADESHAMTWHVANSRQRSALVGFVSGRANSAGWPWVEATIRAKRAEWPADVLVQTIQASSRRRDGWELAADLGSEVEAAYWASFQGFWTGSDAWVAIAKLLDFGHPYAAIDLISAQLQGDTEFNATIAHRALLQAPKAEPRGTHDASMLQTYLPELLDRLEAAGVAETAIGRLEWVYLTVLEHSDRPATRLGQLLATDPAFFVEVLSLVYRAADEPPREPDGEQLRVAEQARRLLSIWRTPPGSTNTGIDGEILRTWADAARTQAREANRTEIADFTIGRVLWWSPKGADGHTPAEPVRDLIETLASASLESGFVNEAFNSRGATFRGPGGEQERVLARKHQETADALRGAWSRTAAIYDGLAAGYLEDAARWDIEEAIRADDEADRA